MSEPDPEPKKSSEEDEDGTITGYYKEMETEKRQGKEDPEDSEDGREEIEDAAEEYSHQGRAKALTSDEEKELRLAAAEPEAAAEAEPVAEEKQLDENSHLFAVRTTGGQEKIVMRMLEARLKMKTIDVQSVLLLDDLKGYVVVEAQDVSSMFNAIQGLRHVRGQLRGELGYNEIEKYLVKKSVVTELEIDKTVEIVGGPFKGMKATITRVDKEKEEATVLLLDAPYQLPITVDANYLKLIPT